MKFFSQRNQPDLTELGTNIARYGLARHEAELADVARRAQAIGAAPAIVSLLTDRSAPDVVRTRALARVAAALAQHPVTLSVAA